MGGGAVEVRMERNSLEVMLVVPEKVSKMEELVMEDQAWRWQRETFETEVVVGGLSLML